MKKTKLSWSYVNKRLPEDGIDILFISEFCPLVQFGWYLEEQGIFHSVNLDRDYKQTETVKWSYIPEKEFLFNPCNSRKAKNKIKILKNQFEKLIEKGEYGLIFFSDETSTKIDVKKFDKETIKSIQDLITKEHWGYEIIFSLKKTRSIVKTIKGGKIMGILIDFNCRIDRDDDCESAERIARNLIVDVAKDQKYECYLLLNDGSRKLYWVPAMSITDIQSAISQYEWKLLKFPRK